MLNERLWILAAMFENPLFQAHKTLVRTQWWGQRGGGAVEDRPLQG